MSNRFWLLTSTLCGIGLLYVTAMPAATQGEIVQTIVEIVHSFPKAKDGEQY